jgi:hypothetical protein
MLGLPKEQNPIFLSQEVKIDRKNCLTNISSSCAIEDQRPLNLSKHQGGEPKFSKELP